MGNCCSSDETPKKKGKRPVISHQGVEGLRLTPQQRRDPETNRPIQPQDFEISRDALRTALGNVAGYITEQNRQITLIAVGGAVNTILLRTRDATHDVDFFSASAKNSEISLISQAGRFANEQAGLQLGEAWINNSTSLFMSRGMLRRLTDEAEIQREVVFEAPGLRVLAAPWNYAFATKLDRISKGTGRPYDPTDAANYLHRYSSSHGNQITPVDEVMSWSSDFGTTMRREDLMQVNQVYHEKYGRDGIAF